MVYETYCSKETHFGWWESVCKIQPLTFFFGKFNSPSPTVPGIKKDFLGCGELNSLRRFYNEKYINIKHTMVFFVKRNAVCELLGMGRDFHKSQSTNTVENTVMSSKKER